MRIFVTKSDTKADKLSKYVRSLKRNLSTMSMSKYKGKYSEEILSIKRQLSNPELWYKVYVTEIHN